MSAFRFLVDTYETERLKTLTVWTQFKEQDLHFRPAPPARTPLEHMVHQCTSEDGWMQRMLGIETGMPVVPAEDTRRAFLEHYAAASAKRLAALAAQPDAWFGQEVDFFDVKRPRAWVLTRRVAHSAHHRGQLTVYLRLLGRPLYSTYGPTADTGGLAVHGATVVYRYATVERLLERELGEGDWPPLPGPGTKPVSERPG
jgi:uncharacterized damage-inducible protein DinB